jgi:hypothetical protein
MSHLEHKATSPASVRCSVLTISDTRELRARLAALFRDERLFHERLDQR